MSVLTRLASALDRNDEEPNIALAHELVDQKDKGSVKELVKGLFGKNTAVQKDAIKVLYEIGTLNPEMILPYRDEFLELLHHKNNRLQWGAMTALYSIVQVDSEGIYEKLPFIVEAANTGSVITRDYAVNILIELMSKTKFKKDAFVLLREQLIRCPTNQLPMYAERALSAVPLEYDKEFAETLQHRLKEINKESKRRRVEKVIKKVLS